MATPGDVAKWLLAEVTEHRYLAQFDAVYGIGQNFGDEIVYTNQTGNPAMSPAVLNLIVLSTQSA